MMKRTAVTVSTSLLVLAMVVANTNRLFATSDNNATELESAITSVGSLDLLNLAETHQDLRTSRGIAPETVKSANGSSTTTLPLSDLEQATECDAATGRLDQAVIETRALEGAYLIIIARLGKGEKSIQLNQRRLSVVEEYVLRRGTDLKYVLAVGPKVKGLGRIELFVGGRLLHTMPLVKNAPGYCLPGREGY